MRRSNLLVALAIAALATLVVLGQAEALQTVKAYKVFTVNIMVTPSPTPVAFARPWSAPDAGISFASLRAPDAQVAQTSSQGAPVPVQFITKSDPFAQYLKVVVNTPTIQVPYGPSSYTCVFTVFTYYPTAYTLSDWGFGTSTSGSGSFPVMNYPTASYLSWTVPDLSSTTTVYANQGSPGQKAWSGTAGQSQTHCVNLTINVPNTQPAGAYQAVLEYSMTAS